MRLQHSLSSYERKFIGGLARILYRSAPAIFVSYRAAAANSDCVLGDDQSGRQLAAFELVRGMLDFVKDAVNKLGVIARGDDLIRRCLLLEIHFQDRIH